MSTAPPPPPPVRHTLRVIWPLRDLTVPARQIAEEVAADLPAIAARAGAEVCGPPRYSLARSADVPGSGCTTPWVLVYEAPAQPRLRKVTPP